MKFLMIAMALGLSISTDANAFEEATMQCTTIDNDIVRLECFDAAFAKVQNEKQCRLDQGAIGRCGAWALSFDRFNLDGQSNPAAKLKSSRRVIASGILREKAELRFSCDGKQVGFAIYAGGVPTTGPKETVSIKYQLDDNAAQNVKMDLWYDKTMTTLWGTDALQFVRQLAQAKKALFQILTTEFQIFDAEFDLSGTGDMLNVMAKECRWNEGH